MEEYYQADRKGGDDRTKKKKSSSGERERRMAEEMAGGRGTDSAAPVRPSRRVVAEEAGPVRAPAEQPVYARRSSRDVRRDDPPMTGDIRATPSSVVQASADPKETRTGVDELSRTGRKSSRRVTEGSGSEAAPARAASTPEPLARPSSARRRVDLAPPRATPEPSSVPMGSSSSRAPLPEASSSSQSAQSAMMNAAMDAEAAARAEAVQREKRLQEKREKRRMLMEKEAIPLARNKQDDVSSASASSLAPVSLDMPVRQQPEVAVDFMPKKKHSPKPSPKAPAKSTGDEDGYDDDFENYSGDEFEAEPEDKQEDKPHKKKDTSPAKSEPADVERRSAGAKATSATKGATSSAAPSARKGVFTSCWSSLSGDGPKADAHGPSTASKLASALHPRAQRVKQLQLLVPLEVERFVDLNLQPVPPYELYQRRIRASSTNTKGSGSSGAAGVGEGIHQSGTQTNDDARSLDVQTEEVVMADKQMQFYLSDDTDFLEAIKKAAATREGKAAKKEKKDVAPVSVPLDAASVNRLMGFLQRASPVCETLLEENISQVRKSVEGEEVDRLPEGSNTKDGSIFKKESSWVTILTALSGHGSSRQREGKEEEAAAPSQGGWMGLLADRPLLEVHSNGQQPHIVMSVHGHKPFVPPAPVKEKKSSKKDKTSSTSTSTALVDNRSEAMARRCIVALWDAKLLAVGRATGPSKLLCCEGLLSVTCFGPGMLSVVVAGTDTGALHLWDLREPKDAHITPWGLENGITMGLRAPTYSTLGSGGIGHVSRIVTITPFTSDGGGSTTFQLASLDDRGILTLWMVSEVTRESSVVRGGGHHVEDAGLTLGGKLRLSRSRSLDVLSPGKKSGPQADGPRQHGLGTGAGAGAKGGTERRGRVGEAWVPRGSLREVNWDLNICDLGELEMGPGAVTLAFFPKDPNRFLVGLTSGVVLHCSRFGTAKAPKTFERAGSNWGLKKSNSNRGLGLGADSLFPPSPATCIHFSPLLPDHFLVAYADGVLCLFVASYAEPLRQWDAAAVAPPLPPSKQLGWALSQEVSWISWSPHRPFVFYALLGRRGLLLAFDLSRNDRAPILNEALCKDDGAGGEDEEGRLCVLSMSAEKTGQIAAGNVPYVVMASQQGVRFRQLRKGLYGTEAAEVSRMKTYLDGVI